MTVCREAYLYSDNDGTFTIACPAHDDHRQILDEEDRTRVTLTLDQAVEAFLEHSEKFK